MKEQRYKGNIRKVIRGLLYAILGLYVLAAAVEIFRIASSVVPHIVAKMGVIPSVLLFPLVLGLVPWYCLLVDGQWWPLIIMYGFLPFGYFLGLLVELIGGKEEP